MSLQAADVADLCGYIYAGIMTIFLLVISIKASIDLHNNKQFQLITKHICTNFYVLKLHII